jgi:hypothetical protein
LKNKKGENMPEEPKRITQDTLNINASLNGDKSIELQGLLLMKGIGVGKMSLAKLSRAVSPLIESYIEAATDIREKYQPDDKGRIKPEELKKMNKELEDLRKQPETTILPKVNPAFLDKHPDIVGKHYEWLMTVLEENKPEEKPAEKK